MAWILLAMPLCRKILKISMLNSSDMKNHSKSTLNTIEEVLAELNELLAQKEKEDYARIFIKRHNISTTYQSGDYLTIMDIRSTSCGQKNWVARFTL
ncbi:hypothetical protein [Emticicia fluvialis]|uniref:hypothetical protein n=1 Tax=Emticicia fluvialis TaxID=2974474 RepID=UPI00216552F9|nr:hypothetical protein [Emticicia fluvialis]